MVVSRRLIAEVSKPYRDLKLIPRQIQRTRLNHEITDVLMARHRQEQRKGLLAFTVGERVSFQGPEGRPISGTIKRVNQKTLTI